ncbi:SMP-30/gluconolactonase/LRE family protein [Gilvimarinus polysaccharolyticus]|uniref:SMP-30/gluconolactonase/LRE family protein n=1 Tax=Gilvimarinus polysaccharolyticus TaxID=863921 RepID=UPI0006733212|nr:SMP-30/gluconolactonase/LRE family protein [Gilvimarinus polysaccharolyticus]
MKKILLFNFFIASVLALRVSASVPPISETEDWLAENTFTAGIEGPAVDRAGNLYAVNIERQGTIGLVSAKNTAEVFVELSGTSVANAIRFDAAGDMLLADYVNHNILKIKMADKSISVLAHNDKMNQPNDIVVADGGIIYASDPNWDDNSGQLWRINTDGTSDLLETAMGTTNGIELSPDGRALYVNESVQRNIWRYDVAADGSITNKQLFFKFADFGMDGMSVDIAGNVYVARYGAGRVAVLSPQGELLREVILTGQHPTNIAFGGKDGRRVFVTMQKRGTVESFINSLPGSDWAKLHAADK